MQEDLSREIPTKKLYRSEYFRDETGAKILVEGNKDAVREIFSLPYSLKQGVKNISTAYRIAFEEFSEIMRNEKITRNELINLHGYICTMFISRNCQNNKRDFDKVLLIMENIEEILFNLGDDEFLETADLIGDFNELILLTCEKKLPTPE